MPAPSRESPLPFAGPAKQFAQERARKTYEALIEAGGRLFAERGFDATQTPDIAARAGVSVGTFYRYFTDKLEIFLEVQRRQLARAYHEVMAKLGPERFAGVDRRTAIEEAVAILLENINRSPENQRVFLEMALRDEKVAALKREFDQVSRQALSQLITTICPREQVADPEAMAYIIHTAVVECAISISGARGAPPVSPDRALRAVTQMVYRAVFGFEGPETGVE